MFLQETAAATMAYNAQMLSLNSARDAQMMRVNTMHRELLEAKQAMIQKHGWFSPKYLGTAEQAEWAEYEDQMRQIEQGHRRTVAPIKEAYAKAIAPAQRRLQEARNRKALTGYARSPSDLARERQG